MTATQRQLVLTQIGVIGGITSALAAGRPVENWPQKIQGCLDIIASTIADDDDLDMSRT